MSIGGNLSMALLNSDFAVPAVTSAAGNAVSAGNAASGLMGETPFRKLIAKALEGEGTASGSQSTAQTDATADMTGSAAQNSESVSDMIASLLFGSAGQAKLKIQSQDETSTDETLLNTVTQDDTDDSDETVDSLASLLAMFDGTFNATAVVTDDSGATTETELTAADLASLLESVQPGKNGISGLLNRREQMTDLVETADDSGKTDPVTLLSQTTDASGKLTVLAEIGGKQIEFTGYLNGSADSADTSAESVTASTGATDDASSAESAATSQGMTLEELTALLAHGGNSNQVTGLGRLNQAHERASSDQQDSGFEHQADTAAVNGRSDAAEKTTQAQSGSDLTGSEDSGEDGSDDTGSTSGNVTAAAYQTHMHAATAADNTAAVQTSQKTDTTEAYSQVSDQILTTLEKKGTSEFKMQLQPENLGQIDISLKISEGKLIIDIAADKAQTQTLLTSQVDKLITSLGLQNVQVERVQVTQQMNSDSQNQAYQQQNSGMNYSGGRQDSGDNGQSWQQFSGGIFGSQTEFTADDALEAADLTGSNFGRMNYRI